MVIFGRSRLLHALKSQRATLQPMSPETDDERPAGERLSGYLLDVVTSAVYAHRQVDWYKMLPHGHALLATASHLGRRPGA